MIIIQTDNKKITIYKLNSLLWRVCNPCISASLPSSSHEQLPPHAPACSREDLKGGGGQVTWHDGSDKRRGGSLTNQRLLIVILELVMETLGYQPPSPLSLSSYTHTHTHTRHYSEHPPPLKWGHPCLQDTTPYSYFFLPLVSSDYCQWPAVCDQWHCACSPVGSAIAGTGHRHSSHTGDSHHHTPGQENMHSDLESSPHTRNLTQCIISNTKFYYWLVLGHSSRSQACFETNWMDGWTGYTCFTAKSALDLI